jgi:hypothetical protein
MPLLHRVTEDQKQRLVWCMARYGVTFDAFFAPQQTDDRVAICTHISREEAAALQVAAQSMAVRVSPLMRGLVRSFIHEHEAMSGQRFPPDYDRWGWMGPNRPVPESDG